MAERIGTPVLQVSDLTITAPGEVPGSEVRIVEGLSLTINQGEMLGLIGESGSGKSMTASALMGLLPAPLRMVGGSVRLNDRDVKGLKEKEWRRLRGKEIAYIFQNYQGAFTPFRTVGKQMVEALLNHEPISREEAKARALEELERVRLPADRVFRSYSFQLSGGQLQRASLAASLMLRPSLIIADEPTTALDVVTGELVLDLLHELKTERGCAVLFISHDLSHVKCCTDRMAVMYGGKLVETGPTPVMWRSPEHPYTRLLLQARPRLTCDKKEPLATIPGEPGAISREGCPFVLRCPLRTEICSTPAALEATDHDGSHLAACHHLTASAGLPAVEEEGVGYGETVAVGHTSRLEVVCR